LLKRANQTAGEEEMYHVLFQPIADGDNGTLDQQDFPHVHVRPHAEHALTTWVGETAEVID
jgi:hypothetical protein